MKGLEALYNESDMTILHGQLKDRISMLNTIMNVLQRFVKEAKL